MDIETFLNYQRAINRPVKLAERALKQSAVTVAAPAQANSAAAAPSVSFGSTTKPPAPAAGGFSFGGSATPAPAPAAGGFSFGGSSTPAPAPAVGGFSFGGSASPAPAPAAGGFSFGGSASTPKAAAPKALAAPGSGMSFGGAATPNPAAPAGGNDEPSDTIGTAKPEAVEHLVDPDWKEVLSVSRVNYFVKEKDAETGELVRKKFGPFPLRLEQHATIASSRRMVLRDPNAGRVRLNLGIGVGMPIKATKRPSSSGKMKVSLLIVAIRDPIKGPEQFHFVTGEEFFDDFVAKITEWTKA